MIPKPPPEPVEPRLEILPGLVVQPRFINGNWYLVPVDEDLQLPDVEGMVIEDLAKEILAGELTAQDKCCIIEALAKRRGANIETLRQVMGLFGTDKPLPLTEIPPLALPEGTDLLLNAMPTAEQTGIEAFDLIEYSYTQFSDPGRIYGEFFYGNWRGGLDWQTFRHNDHVKIWIEEIATGKKVSVTHDVNLKMTEWWVWYWPPPPFGNRGRWACWPLECFCFVIPYGSNTFDLVFDSGPYGCGKDGQRAAEQPCGHLECIAWCDPPHNWPRDDSLGLEISGSQVNAEGLWQAVPNGLYRIVVEFPEKRKFAVNIVLNYYSHQIGDFTLETREYYKSYPDKSLLAEVAKEEIVLLDDMRVNSLINGPQWSKAKNQLDEMSKTKLTW